MFAAGTVFYLPCTAPADVIIEPHGSGMERHARLAVFGLPAVDEEKAEEEIAEADDHGLTWGIPLTLRSQHDTYASFRLWRTHSATARSTRSEAAPRMVAEQRGQRGKLGALLANHDVASKDINGALSVRLEG